MPWRHLREIFLGLLALLSPASVLAQSIMVEVVEAESLTPIPTAFVTLVDGEGHPVRSALTNPEGRTLFPLPRPGTFRIRAEMFGRRTTWSPDITVGEGQSLSHRFALPLEAIALPEIRVKGERQCKIRPQEGVELARVWDEARKALTIQNWTGEDPAYEFQVVLYERELDRRGREVLSESRREGATLAQNPIRSRPPEELMTEGFVRIRHDGSWDYFGPDASVLLSDIFLNTHCFRLREEGSLPGWIGLGFEPVREEKLPDIAGTLWLDRATSHLGYLDFEYLQVPSPLNRGRSEGRVEFERLPNGAWIIRNWWIRSPMMGRIGDDGRWFLTGVQETGGEVTEIRTVGR